MPSLQVPKKTGDGCGGVEMEKEWYDDLYVYDMYIYTCFFDFLFLGFTLLKYKASFFWKAANIFAIRKQNSFKIALFIGRFFTMIATWASCQNARNSRQWRINGFTN